MSKRMHIYAAAIDPLRKKFGISACEVAEKVNSILNHNDKLEYDLQKTKKELETHKNHEESLQATIALRNKNIEELREKVSSLETIIAAAKAIAEKNQG